MHLFAAFLGGPIADDRMGEDHEIVFVIAGTPEEAKVQAKKKWRGAGRAHVDAVQRIDEVDGFKVSVTPAADGQGDRTQLKSYN
ncbi:MAG: DUF1543 domain-containing protein [Nitrososphaerales archaeon]